MAGHRIDRINEEIKKELSSILPKIKDPRVPDFISVTQVITTPDLKEAKVYFSIFSGDEKEVLKGLKSSGGFIRRALSKSLNLRYTPVLSFFVDDSIKQGMKINDILSKLDIKHDENEKEDN